MKKKLLNIGVPKDSSIVRALEKWSFPLKKYSMKRVERSIPIFIDIFTELIKNLELEEYEKASVLASAVHNLPGFVSKEY
ncbi:hypothetical protein M6D81_31605, partial [Paenibacillus sp. J5C_2022]|uniref:hypothetical protein n=1 Tax=Paenibacillus sp. J5C2022 TaxID=2977129 RepID=UPI0021D0EC65